MCRVFRHLSVLALSAGMAVTANGTAFAQAAQAAVSELTRTAPEMTDCMSVLEGVQYRFHGYDSWRKLTLTITDEAGSVKTRQLVSAHKSYGVNRHMRSMVVEPVELRGVESFSHDNTQGGLPDRMWTWLPSRNAALELKSEDMSQRVFGSDLAVGEMMTREARDYDCRMLGRDLYRGREVYKIYVKPIDEKEILRVGLTDGEVWADAETFLPVYSSFNADAPNEQRIFEVINAHWVDGVYAAQHFRVSTLKEGRVVSYTDFQTETEVFNRGLPDSFFDLNDLGSGDSAFRDYRPVDPRSASVTP